MASALDDLKAGKIFTGGMYGALSSLASFLRHEANDAGRIVAFFDNGVPSARLKLIPGYKQARKERNKLVSDADKMMAFRQMHYARKMFESLGVICVAFEKREADDDIMAAVRVLTARGEPCIVVSSDKDLWQAVYWGARVWCLGKKVWLDAKNFEATTGVCPSLYVLYKALVGDPSDSIKGADGCGPGRAVKLLREVEGLSLSKSCSLGTLWPPSVQLTVLAAYMKAKPKPRKFELGIVADYERLADKLRGIDLSNSFGGRGVMARVLERTPPVEPLTLVRYARRFNMQTVVGGVTRFVDPFRWAAKRRDGKKPKKWFDKAKHKG